MIRFIFGKIVLPTISLSAIAAGYYLLWINTSEILYEDVANRALLGVLLTVMGGLGSIIYMFRLGK